MSETCFVAIAAWNEEQRIGKLLSRLGDTQGVSETWVLDDGSTDNTSGIASMYGAHILHPDKRQGLIQARKLLMDQGRKSTATWFCFIDADVVPQTAGWLVDLSNAYHNGIMGPKLLSPSGLLWAAGGTWDRQEASPECPHATARGYQQPDGPRYAVHCEVPHVPGAVMFFRRELLDLGLDAEPVPGWVRNCDDTDLCMQLQFKIGERCWYAPVPFVHDDHAQRRLSGEPLQPDDEYWKECRFGAEHFRRKWGARIKQEWGV